MSGEEFSLDNVLGQMSKAEDKATLLEMLKEVNKVLGELQKTVDFFKRIGVLPGIIRAYGKAKGIDMETPLKSEMSVAAPTGNHKAVMENISKLTDEQLFELVKGMQEYGQKNLDSGKSPDRQPDSKNN